MIVLDGFRGEKNRTRPHEPADCCGQQCAVPFSIKLEDGSVADSTALHGKPARLRMGDGSLTPSFEQCLLGLREGRARALPWRRKRRSASPIPTTSTISIAPNSVTKLSPRWVPSFCSTSPTAANARDHPGGGRDVGHGRFQPPLAGHTVTFEVEILGVDDEEKVH
jgi:FKBP-type peptidyl-prolyl cis-trans isomerase SlpA